MSTNQYQEAWIASAPGRKVDRDNDASFDCVDVPKDYAINIWANTTWKDAWPGAGNACDMINTYNPEYFDRIDNDPNNPAQIPERGDVIVYGGAPINPAGHIAVVLDADQNGVDVVQEDSFMQCPMYVGRLGYTNAGTGECTGWLRPKFDATEQPVVTTAGNITFSQRVVGQYGVTERDAPSAHGNALRTFDPGTPLDFKGYVHGDAANGTDIWFVGAYAGNYFSASAFDDSSVAGLSDITPAPTPAPALQPYQRVVGVDSAIYRDASNTSGNVLATFKKGDTLNFKGYVHGQNVNGTDIWFVGSYSNGYISASNFDDSSTNGLSDLTPPAPAPVPAPAPAPAASATRTVGSQLNVRDAPYLNGNLVTTEPAGTVVTVKGYVPNGDSVNGNAVWFNIDKGWIWSGGVDSQSTAGLILLPTQARPSAPQYSGLNGIDISGAQKGIDLTKISLDFVIVKATEGVGWSDPEFQNNLGTARKTGKPVGFYHFARPLAQAGNTAQAEADSFVSVVKPILQPGDFVALDWEAENTSNVAWAKEWLDRVSAALGVKPLFYSYLNVLSANDFSSISSDYGLWYAQYPTAATQQGYGPVAAHAAVPGNWKIVVWQYSSAGILPGWTEKLDLDILFGNEADLAAIGYKAPAPSPQPAPAPTTTTDPAPAPSGTGTGPDKATIVSVLSSFFKWLTDLFVASR